MLAVLEECELQSIIVNDRQPSNACDYGKSSWVVYCGDEVANLWYSLCHTVLQTFPRHTRLKVSQEILKPADFEAWKASIRVIVGLVDWLMISIISFRFIVNSIVLGYVSNVSRLIDLSRKKMKFFIFQDCE